MNPELPVKEIEIEGGGRLLQVKNRPDAADATRKREPARIITMVWGDRYVADLLSTTIPALLAPGNIPTFVRHFDCELVIVTETRLFDQIAAAPVTAQLLRCCDVRLIPVDDLLSPWYGITLTYALVRGFVDLGSKMVDTHLVFFNADFIVADGSYAKLAELILRGERLVVSPSYCMVLEETVDQLRSRYDQDTCAITISRRDMAKLILQHRHNTIRAKTVNQKLFRIHRYDQFYWNVDERTLIGRQMPIAVIYMRPERVIAEMPTFWDYGVISEMCPTVKPCVLGDSDDFLMGELRADGTSQERLHLGWPTVDEIAADLSSFTTKDHRDYGRHTLLLHSDHLPPTLEDEKAKFNRFVDSVYDRLSPPVSYRNHPFWANAFPRFSAMRVEQGHQRQIDEWLTAELRRDPREKERREHIEALEQRIATLASERHAAEAEVSGHRRAMAEKLAAMEERHRLAKEELAEAFSAVTRDGTRVIQTLGAQEAELTGERSLIIKESVQCRERLLRAIGTDVADENTVQKRVRLELGRLPVAEEATPQLASVAQKTPLWLQLCGWLYDQFLGRLPRTTRWHPFHTVLRHAYRAITTTDKPIADVLIVSVGGALVPLLLKGVPARKVVLSPQMLFLDVYAESLLADGRFDLCVCDLPLEDLLNFKNLFERLRRHMIPGGRLIIFHHNSRLRNLDDWTLEFTEKLFPFLGNSEIRFSGSRVGALAMRGYNWLLQRHNVAQVFGIVIGAFVLAYCAPLARIASFVEERRNPNRLPARCTSMTIEINL